MSSTKGWEGSSGSVAPGGGRRGCLRKLQIDPFTAPSSGPVTAYQNHGAALENYRFPGSALHHPGFGTGTLDSLPRRS